MPLGYQPRTYRADSGSSDLQGWRLVVAETDLYIQAEEKLVDLSREAARQARAQVEREIARRPEFASSLRPLPATEDAPPVVAAMYAAAAVAGVGPMAAVAGAIAQFIGEQLEAHSRQVIVENGGDIYLHSECERLVAVRAGQSPFTDHLGLIIPPGRPSGVCTSSSTVGHSRSAGQADAAVITAAGAALADAVATALGNRVQRTEDSQQAVEWALTLPSVWGALVVCGLQLAAGGDVELRRL